MYEVDLGVQTADFYLWESTHEHATLQFKFIMIILILLDCVVAEKIGMFWAALVVYSRTEIYSCGLKDEETQNY